jgi:hypothetical protein
MDRGPAKKQTRHLDRDPLGPAHEGVPSNENADEWAELAADEPDAHGVEWLYREYGGGRSMALPRSLANFKREISEKKWVEARR